MITTISGESDFEELREQTVGRDYIFRGQSNFLWDLKATIQREGNEPILLEELKVYKEFREELTKRGLPLRKTPQWAAGQWLSLMQHYGLPTRLLDWTENLLVALFFACENNEEYDGSVFVLNPSALSQAVGPAMSRIPTELRDPDPIPYFFFPEDRFIHFHAGEGNAVVAPISPIGPNEREDSRRRVHCCK